MYVIQNSTNFMANKYAKLYSQIIDIFIVFFTTTWLKLSNSGYDEHTEHSIQVHLRANKHTKNIAAPVYPTADHGKGCDSI